LTVAEGSATIAHMSKPPAKAHTVHDAFASHPRDWRENRYVYPVLSRRSGGLSIGVNLNPDKACNFDCVYCQVDRTVPPTVRKVDVEILRRELDRLAGLAASGAIFDEPPFDAAPPALRRLNDIAFSGDGEPTTSPEFLPAVQAAAQIKAAHGLDDVKIVLITDACYLTRPKVREALAILDANNGELWAKLDAGTEAYYRRVNRPNYPLTHVMENIVDAARIRPVVIQALWMRIDGAPPPAAEVEAFADRLNEIRVAGGTIKLVQVYTIARQPAESYVTPLADGEVDAIAATVRERCDVPVATYYGLSQ
jgi:wyosine [tRNA(Phe)-imidazoG37] synthetase (radical SAM superfamily)